MTTTWEALINLLRKYLDERNWEMAKRTASLIAELCEDEISGI